MKRLSNAVLVLSGIIMMIGCSQDVKIADTSSVSDAVKEAVASYSSIGEQHNKVLEEFYFGAGGQSRSALAEGGNYKDLGANDLYGSAEYIYFGDMSTGRSATSTSITNELVEKELLSPGAVELISRMENLLLNPLGTRELMEQAILEIQELAVSTLKGTELDQVMSYAETAKASLEFWTENMGTLTGENEGWSLTKWWNTNKHRIAMTAVSDAAGAAVGAILGASIGSSAGGVGAGPGAGVGAVICGAASSIQGFKDDKFCVVIPWEKISDSVVVQ